MKSSIIEAENDCRPCTEEQKLAAFLEFKHLIFTDSFRQGGDDFENSQKFYLSTSYCDAELH